MKIGRLALPLLLVLVLLSALLVTAQESTPDPACEVALLSLWTAASNACVTGPEGTICNGGAAPQAEPEGLVSNTLTSLGAMVEAGEVTMLHTPPIDTTINSLGI